jgi:hypothetical protein
LLTFALDHPTRTVMFEPQKLITGALALLSRRHRDEHHRFAATITGDRATEMSSTQTWSRWYRKAIAKAGDIGVWPFMRKRDFEAALRRPPYLHGCG